MDNPSHSYEFSGLCQPVVNSLQFLFLYFYILFILRILLALPIQMNIFAFFPRKKKKNSVPTFNMSNLGRPLSSSIEQTLKYIHSSGTSNL